MKLLTIIALYLFVSISARMHGMVDPTTQQLIGYVFGALVAYCLTEESKK